MKMHRKRLRRGEEGENQLAEGIRLLTEQMREEEPRIGTLLIKGFLVYLIVMGEIGCFLTSLDIRCSWWVIHIGVLASMAYHAGKMVSGICILSSGRQPQRQVENHM